MVRIVEKSWGRELIFADEPEYCGKFLIYDKKGAISSLHFHLQKKETWYVQFGSFKYVAVDKTTAEETVSELRIGDTVTLVPGQMHQLTALEDQSIIVEVSTKDSADDTYRIRLGDKQ